MYYQIWIDIEAVDEETDEYVTVDTPGAAVASFVSHHQAFRFVEWLHDIAIVSGEHWNADTEGETV